MRFCKLCLVFLSLMASACSSDVVSAPDNLAVRTNQEDCNPELAEIPCDYGEPTYGHPNLGGLNIGYTWNQCLTPYTDVDSDGIHDGCETALAAAFAPLLKVKSLDCNWDSSLDRLGGEYYYMVQRPIGVTDRIRIAYMPAYYNDCGAEGHEGDTEFIGVDVKYQFNNQGADTWQFEGAFLSAHCGAQIPYTDFGSADPNCRYFGRATWDTQGQYADGTNGGAPVVWVSVNKHANYFSQHRCNSSVSGTFNVDQCHSDQVFRRFPVQYTWQNIDFPESNAYNCIPPRWGSSIPLPTARESFSPSPYLAGCGGSETFYGWQNPSPTQPHSGGSENYYHHLVNWLRMKAPISGGSQAPPTCTYDPVVAEYNPGCTAG